MPQSQSDSIDWHTSTFSAAGNCVQAAKIGGSIAVRDSKDPEGPVLMYSADEWEAFLDGVQSGDFDALA